MWILPVTAMVKAIGHDLRILAMHQKTVGSFIATTLLVHMAPIAIACVNYIAVGKLLAATGKSAGCVTPRMVARLFLISDILCFFVQAGGGGMLAMQDPGLQKLGTDIALFGLAIQLVFFTAFTAMTGYLQCSRKFRLSGVPATTPLFRGMYVTIALLFVRNVYRVAEFASGIDNYLVANEWVFYVFDAAMIWLALMAYAWWNFDRLLSPEVALAIAEHCGAGTKEGATATVAPAATTEVAPAAASMAAVAAAADAAPTATTV